MTAFASHNRFGTGFPFLTRAALAIGSLLLAAWIAWVALFTALVMVPVVVVTAVVARLLRRRRVLERANRFDGPVIDGEYHVIPPER